MMKLTIEAVCQKGPKRDNNEDMVSLGGILLRDADMNFPVEIDESSQFYLLVADGMGGHEHGERASQGLLEYLDECFKENRFHADTIEDDLRFQVKTFSDRLNEEAREEGQVRPMGCTLTGMVWTHGKALLINAGDSRTYLFRDPYLRQLSVDQTERGLTGDPEASKYLLNCIGGGSYGRLVVEDITDRLLDGDLLLVCSDGLSDMVNDAAMEAVLGHTDDPLPLLYEMACDKGGYDNISVIVARLTRFK